MSLEINPYLLYLYRKFGKLALIGVCLLVCALTLFVVDKAYQQQKLTNLQDALTKLSSENKTLAKQKALNQPSGGIDAVFDLRKKTDMLNVIEMIQTIAKENHIYVDNIDYKFSKLPSVNADRYEVTFPANGKYLDFRKFLKQLTQYYNGVVVQQIEFSRDDNQVIELDGLLKLAVYVKGSK